MAQTRTIPSPYGEGRLHTSRSRRPVATLLISHGAGNGVDTPDLAALAASLPRHGITVLRFEQPWKVAGRKVATPPATLDAGLVAAANQIRTRTPLVVGGRSAGARSGARMARSLGASGCLALAFPLHPPGKPERSRVDELQGAGVPTLVIQGERDPMGTPDEFPAGIEMTVVPDADHSFRVPKRSGLSEDDVAAILVEATLEWIIREIVGNAATH